MTPHLIQTLLTGEGSHPPTSLPPTLPRLNLSDAPTTHRIACTSFVRRMRTTNLTRSLTRSCAHAAPLVDSENRDAFVRGISKYVEEAAALEQLVRQSCSHHQSSSYASPWIVFVPSVLSFVAHVDAIAI